jgi:hypothetical protein
MYHSLGYSVFRYFGSALRMLIFLLTFFGLEDFSITGAIEDF